MTNDLTTLDGSLDEMKDQLISELGDKGVTATFDSSTGLLGLVSKIGDIQTGGGGGCPQLVTGTFTTGSSTGTATETINYNGSGYPILTLVEIDGGVYNNGTGGNTTWYNSTTLRYYVGHVIITKARTTTAPTYDTSGENNYGVITYTYKSSSQTATSYSRAGSMNANTYTNSSTNPSSGNTCVRFKGNGKTLAYYIGNGSTSTYGLAKSTQYRYTILYSE